MLKAFQIRTIAAVEQIEAMLRIAVNIIPKDMDKIQIHETVMRGLIELDERARLAQPGESDLHYTARLIRNHLKGGSVNKFYSEATRSYTVSQLLELQ